MSPRSAEQFDRMRAESRARIVDAALHLFAEHGYDGTSVRMIAERAGVSPGLLYHYFPAKEALLRALFEATMEDVRASFAQRILDLFLAAKVADIPKRLLR